MALATRLEHRPPSVLDHKTTRGKNRITSTLSIYLDLKADRCLQYYHGRNITIYLQLPLLPLLIISAQVGSQFHERFLVLWHDARLVTRSTTAL